MPPEPRSLKGTAFFGEQPQEAEGIAKTYLGQAPRLTKNFRSSLLYRDEKQDDENYPKLVPNTLCSLSV